MTEPAHLLLAEHDATDPWWFPARYSAGAATLVQQFSEATENLLRRTFQRAQDLRKAGYALDAAYFVLGWSESARPDSRFAVARCLQSVLEPRIGVLHLVAGTPNGQLVAFQLADRLRSAGSAYQLEMHFPESACPGPTLSRYTSPRVQTNRVLDVA